MARFRKKAYRRSSGFRSFARRSNKVSGGMKVTDVLIAGVIYGVTRPLVAKVLPDFFSFGPVTSDNVIIGGAGYLATKQKNGIVKALGVMALGGEAAQVTSNLMTGTSPASSNTGSISTAWN